MENDNFMATSIHTVNCFLYIFNMPIQLNHLFEEISCKEGGGKKIKHFPSL